MHLTPDLSTGERTEQEEAYMRDGSLIPTEAMLWGNYCRLCSSRSLTAKETNPCR